MHTNKAVKEIFFVGTLGNVKGGTSVATGNPLQPIIIDVSKFRYQIRSNGVAHGKGDSVEKWVPKDAVIL